MKHGVGISRITNENNNWGGAYPTLVLYPSIQVSAETTFGPFTIRATQEAPILPGKHPIVVISHGTGGTPFGYRDIATYLAEHRYVVLLPEHPGNNHRDDRLANTTENLQYRPKHISLAVDLVSNHERFFEHVEAGSYTIIGHSMGGYTALALAGGEPSIAPNNPIAVDSDHRVNAVVLLAPAALWYQAPLALVNLSVPVLIYSGEKDDITPTTHTDVITQNLPKSTPVVHHIVKNAGHFSFMSPFPEAMCNPQFLPGNDPEGFDRPQFQHILAAEIYDFLQSLRSQPAQVKS